MFCSLQLPSKLQTMAALRAPHESQQTGSFSFQSYGTDSVFDQVVVNLKSAIVQVLTDLL
jgi:hypothetical protein